LTDAIIGCDVIRFCEEPAAAYAFAASFRVRDPIVVSYHLPFGISARTF
jgi:hypothetical protein